MAPTLTGFSRRVVDDRCSTSFGDASVRIKVGEIAGQPMKLEMNLVV